MKTFREFIFECYYLTEGRKKPPKYSDEYANINFYNHLISLPNVRELITKKNDAIKELMMKTKGMSSKQQKLLYTKVQAEIDDYEDINKIISQEIENSKSDINHPLNFNNASDEGFSGKKKTQKHKNSYYSQIERSGPGFLSLIQSKKGGSIASKGWIGKVSRDHEASKSSWEGNIKSQGRFDYVFSDPDDSKKQHRVSGKDYRGSQAASAQSDQATATLLKGVSVVANQQMKSYLANKPKKKDGESEQEYKERLSQIELTAKEKRAEILNKGKEKIDIINKLMTDTKGMSSKQQKPVYTEVQELINDLENTIPGTKRASSQEMLKGSGQFDKNKTAQSIWTTGGEGSFRDPRQQSVGLRARAGKGGGRPMAVAGDIAAAPKEKEQENKRQSSFKEFDQKAAEAAKALAQAEKEKEEAKKIIGPDGNEVLRQHAANYLKNNPDKSQERSLKISAAQQNIDTSTANINSMQQQKAESQAASTPSQPTQTPLSTQPQQIQTPPSQPQQPQPTQTPLSTQPQQIQTPPPEQQQAPPQEQVPPTQQQQVPPPEQKPKKKRKLEPENVEQTTEPVA